MKNIESWQPSKYVYHDGKLRASRKSESVSFHSRLGADLVAAFYDRSLRIHAKGELIDLGCGKVPLYASYKNYIKSCVCVDWVQADNDNLIIDYNLDINQKLPFKEFSFDTIILSDVLEHIRKPEQLWTEMYRILQGKGKLIMNVPFFYGIHDIPYDYFRYTEYALKSMAEQAGFKVVSIENIGGLPEIVADLTSKIVSVIPLIGKPIAVFIQVITRLFIKTGIGKKLSIKTGIHFPLGYALIAEKL